MKCLFKVQGYVTRIKGEKFKRILF